jgi:hypothetical protein
MKCSKTYLTFLIANLILNGEARNGSIIKIDKIKEFCPQCDENEIKEILDCFVEYNLLIKTDTYFCKNNHIFTPKKEDFEIGFSCPKCLEEGFNEDEIYITPEEIKKYYSHSTYRINSKENPEIWKAKSYFMIGDIEKAIATLYPIIKDEIKDKKDKKSIIEKIAPYFTIGNAGTNIVDKLLPYIDKFLNYI